MTSHGLSEPGMTRLRSADSLAIWAWSELAYVTNAHCRPGSQPVLRNTSTIAPYLPNSARSNSSVIKSGSEPTNIFLGPGLCCGDGIAEACGHGCGAGRAAW